MDLIEPKRLTTFDPFEIEIITHNEKDKPPGSIILPPLYEFNTISDLKRQIWIAHDGSDEWSPNRTWIAIDIGHSLYKPLDMTWGEESTLSKGVHSPFFTPGKPDRRLVDPDGNKKAVYPLFCEGILLDTALGSKRTIHAWNMSGIKNAIGSSLDDKAVINGYIQLYFPKIQSIEDIVHPTEEAYEAAAEYTHLRNERIKKVEALLSKSTVTESEPFKLRHLRIWNAIIPYAPSHLSLDVSFYEFQASEHVPFLRYFPAKGHGEPLLKLAVGKSGFPLISNKAMLASFLEEDPLRDEHAILMAKIPFPSLATEKIPAIRNIALTLIWTEDGSCSVNLEAPRRDMLIDISVVSEAQTLLDNALASLKYEGKAEIKMNMLSGIYQIQVKTKGKITYDEIKKRVAFFDPFLEESTIPKKQPILALKWKAVDNYEQEDAVYAYFSKQATDGEIIDDAEGLRTMILEASAKFGRTEIDIRNLFEGWFRRRKEVIQIEGEPVLAYNTGVEIEITVSHPLYLVSLQGIDSEKTFRRCLSVLTGLLYYEQLPNSPKPEPLPQPPVPTVTEGRPGQLPPKANISRFMNMFGSDDEEEEPSSLPETKELEKPPAKRRNYAKEETLEIPSEWYVKQLHRYDEKLFKYSGDKVYSRVCQSAQGRMPNVMMPEQLQELEAEYKDDVEFVFLPPEAGKKIILNVKEMETQELLDELKERGVTGVANEKGKTLKKKAELQKLLQDVLCLEPGLQGQICKILRKDQPDKPVWFIARAGSDYDKPHYYICAEYWCLKDMRPLLPSEVKGAMTRDKLPKEKNSCPFCGGKILENLDSPKKGETIIHRKGKHGEDNIHEIVGYTSNIHPQNFAIPCCFTGPTPKIKQMIPEEGTILPKDIRGVKDEDVVVELVGDNIGDAKEDEDADLTKALQTVRTQYILGSEKRVLEPGKIGLCPQALDEILGQNGSESIGKGKGQAQKLLAKSKTFVRFGISNKDNNKGLAFLDLLGFYLGNLQKAGRPQMRGAKVGVPTVLTPAATLDALFSEGPENANFLKNLIRAFERANSGNLLHEFASHGNGTIDIQLFATKLGINLNTEPHNRPYVERLAHAWYNFKAYVSDKTVAKKLSHFENLFSCPNVIFPNGLLLVIFEGKTDEAGVTKVNIRCPDYGVLQYSQKYRPPIAFLWNDLNLGIYEPIIFIEGTGEKDEKGKPEFLVLPTINPEDSKYQTMDSTYQNSIRDFIKQFMTPTEGCGRFTSPSHPWMPDRDSVTIPRLSELLHVKVPEYKAEAVLRDRSNRLVGIIYTHTTKSLEIYIPALEDGSLGLELSSRYDSHAEAIPKPPVLDLLAALTNKSGLGKFTALQPGSLLDIEGDENKYFGLKLKSGAIVPFNPIQKTSKITSSEFEILKDKGQSKEDHLAILPWDEDARFLKVGEQVKEAMDVLPETVLEEAYQFLRLSLSEWLKTDQGKPTLKQLQGLRISKLPLFELRKRGDILLEPLVRNWVNAEGHTQAIPLLALLRKNCIFETTQKGCETSPICKWIGESCKIHIGTSKKIPDIKLYFTHRIVDEIMRYPTLSNEILDHGVSRIRNPTDIIHMDNSILTAKTQIRDLVEDLELNYVPDEDYSAGLTYPESAHADTLGRNIPSYFIEIPEAWKRVGLRRLLADPTIEDRLKSTLVAYTGEGIQQIKRRIKDLKTEKGDKSQINWSDKDWSCFSEVYDLNILVTKYNFETKHIGIVKWFKSTDSDKFCIIFEVETPELLLCSKKTLKREDLPRMMLEYLDSGFPITWDSIV
jgi:hypothetical protein